MSMLRANPIFFGPSERLLFGWMHRTEHDADTQLGIVLCNPFGYEAICTHRMIKTCADRAAGAGIPALRFDYDGTGDSVGDDLDPGRLAAWVGSIHRATETLRDEIGCERFCFLGIRLGATLAALAASERSDVAGLVAIAPIVNGNSYVRELRALQIASSIAASSPAPTASDLMEVTGFVLTAATRMAMSAVDLLQLQRPPAENVLVLDRDDLTGNERWAKHLLATGAHVERLAVSGYLDMMASPHAAAAPAEMLSLTLSWLQNLALSTPTPRSIASAANQSFPKNRGIGRMTSTRQQHAMTEIRAAIIETAVFVDSDRILFGILSAPEPGKPGEPNQTYAPTPPHAGILLLSAGGMHHIGPNRLHVVLSRFWASLGYTVLRVDLAGIGDSAPRPREVGNAIYSMRAVDDVKEALEFLHKCIGGTECCAIGFCSGAYHVFKSAVRGLALDKAVIINPLTFFWHEGMPLDPPSRSDQANAIQLSSEPSPGALESELESVARHRIPLLFIFSESDPGMGLLQMQAGTYITNMIRRQELKIEVIGDADHTFTGLSARTRLTTMLTNAIGEIHSQ